MSKIVQVTIYPASYLIITGLEWLFWRSRFEMIKSQILLNMVLLALTGVIVTAILWIVDNASLCWK